MACVSCKKEPPKMRSTGTFEYDGVKYNISMLRVEHVAYTPSDEAVLRLTAYPSTYSITETDTKGYGAVLNMYFLADDTDFAKGKYELNTKTDSLISTLTFYPDTKSSHDTTSYIVRTGNILIDSINEPNILQYDISLTMDDGKPLIGTYTGLHTHNYSTPQKAFGTFAFDTISCNLAKANIAYWDKIFSTLQYTELTFYSNDATFSDKGVLKDGIQFVIGIHTTDTDSHNLLPNTYPIVKNYHTPLSSLYGHKVKNTAWGTHWQLFQNGSPIGKANILDGNVEIISFDNDSLRLNFDYTDQLKNNVTGSYKGPYTIKRTY